MTHDLAKSLKDKTKVWLYVNAAKDIVGFASLGKTNWNYPRLADPKVRVGIIPNVAVKEKYHGLPKGDGETKYSNQILDHVVAQAQIAGYEHLALYVHPLNEKAQHWYQNRGFALLDSVDGDYLRMALKVPAVQDPHSMAGMV